MVFCFWFEWKGLEGRSQNESGTRFDRHRFVSETARALWNSAASRESEQKVPSAHLSYIRLFTSQINQTIKASARVLPLPKLSFYIQFNTRKSSSGFLLP